MTTGTNTFMGKAVPISGESQITAITAANDILTLTGATSHTGDFFVCENSTGAELFVVGIDGTVSMPTGFAISSTATDAAMNIAVSCTGAIAAGAITANALLVSMTSTATLNSVIGYYSGGGTEAGSTQYFIAVHGSKSPDYFLALGATACGVGAETDNGFLDVGKTMTADPTSASAYAGIKCLFGTKAYYILAVPDSSLS